MTYPDKSQQIWNAYMGYPRGCNMHCQGCMKDCIEAEPDPSEKIEVTGNKKMKRMD